MESIYFLKKIKIIQRVVPWEICSWTFIQDKLKFHVSSHCYDECIGWKELMSNSTAVLWSNEQRKRYPEKLHYFSSNYQIPLPNWHYRSILWWNTPSTTFAASVIHIGHVDEIMYKTLVTAYVVCILHCWLTRALYYQ